MPYFFFNPILASNPVTEDLILEDNWKIADTKVGNMVNFLNVPIGTNMPNNVKGMEQSNAVFTGTAQEHGFCDGTAWKTFVPELWGAWTTLNLLAPYVARTGFPCQYRTSNYNNVQFRGCVINTAGAAAWPTTGFQEVHRGQLQTPYLPGQLTVQPLSASVTAAPTPTKAAGFITTHPGPPVTTRIYLLFENGPGGGNWIDIGGLFYQGA